MALAYVNSINLVENLKRQKFCQQFWQFILDRASNASFWARINFIKIHTNHLSLGSVSGRIFDKRLASVLFFKKKITHVGFLLEIGTLLYLRGYKNDLNVG